MSAATSRFFVSLDFELFWGLRDLAHAEAFRPAVRGVWQAIPALLDVFREYDVGATWATVGMLFANGRDELLAHLPPRRPSYAVDHLSPYASIAQTGQSEHEDPEHYAPSLVRLIQACPRQEIGTHTFSHYYCLEPGQTPDEFSADLEAARRMARRRGIEPVSLVFPRNQYAPAYTARLRQHGILAFRGTGSSWMHRSAPGRDQTRRRRLARLVDSYLPLRKVGARSTVEARDQVVDLPASRFLRPYDPRLRHLEPLRIRRMTTELEAAARSGTDYHLWWHPHNFGTHLQSNLDVLRRVLDGFAAARDAYGMVSQTMGEHARERLHPAPAGARPLRQRGARAGAR